MTLAYYNDNDPNSVKWLRELIGAGLIADGDVDDRSIAEVQSNDLQGYTQVHLFAGIGGWSYALRLAGWDDNMPVWTGSCPCQPFSVAGLGRGEDDPRHLWPHFRRLVKECRPTTIFGEQVASKAGCGWFSRVRADLEASGYAVGCANLPACCVGAPHIRQRLWWVANTSCQRGCQGDIKKTQGRIPQVQDTWHGTGSPFEHWSKLLAQPNACRVDDGISTTVDIRPRLHSYGNAIVPQVAAEFIQAYLEASTLLDSEGVA